MKKLLIIDDELEYLKSLEVALRKIYDVHLAQDYDSAIAELQFGFDLVLIDIRLDKNDENNADGLRILKWLVLNSPSTPAFMMSAFREFRYAEESLNHGARHFFRKPILISELAEVLSEKS
jgi:DNA-binding NtrC family response regulator